MKVLTLIPLVTALIASQASGFGAPDILPSVERSKEYQLQTKHDKKKGFTKLSIWAAKTFSNSNESIKMKDAELGVMVIKGNLPCKALKLGSGYGADQRIELSIEITVEDKKAEIKVSDVVGKSDGSYDDGARPAKPEEMQAAVKECIDPFVDQLKKELN